MNTTTPPQEATQNANATQTQGNYQGTAYAAPPTGLQQQLAGLNQQYDALRQQDMGLGNIGFDTREMQMQQYGSQSLPNQTQQYGSSSLNALAERLAKGYGLSFGRGQLVDESGNFLMTPDQLAAASGGGETLGTAAAKMNYIADAISKEQQQRAQRQGIAAMQTGLGQVQSNARGSLASMQSGLYQGIAGLYANQDYDSADFSYWIQKEQMDQAQELQRRQEKLAKNQARSQFLTGVGVTILGLATGNAGVAGGGAAMTGGAASGTGWF